MKNIFLLQKTLMVLLIFIRFSNPTITESNPNFTSSQNYPKIIGLTNNSFLLVSQCIIYGTYRNGICLEVKNNDTFQSIQNIFYDTGSLTLSYDYPSVCLISNGNVQFRIEEAQANPLTCVVSN